MAIKIKSVDTSTTKWSENAGRAAGTYAAEAEAAADLWARNAAAAGDNFNAAVTAAGIKSRWLKGVAKAGPAKFARKIREVGGDRFGPGVAAATGDYKSEVEPYFSTIASLTLKPRKPKGDPANYARVEQVGKALNAKRLALLGVTATPGA